MNMTLTEKPSSESENPAKAKWWRRRRSWSEYRARLAELRTRVLLRLPRSRNQVAAITGLVWAGITTLRMLWPVPAGLGDAGDGERVLCQIGVAPPPAAMGTSNGYVDFTWDAHRYYGETCGVPTTGERYWSSQLILLRLTTWLGGLTGVDGIDFRLLAVLCSLLVGVAVALLVRVLPASIPIPMRILVASVTGLVMIDSGIARFFASPYAEPAALVGVLLLCPALLWLLQQRRYTWGALLAVTGTGAFAILSKTQMFSLLPPLVVVLLLRPSLPERWHGCLLSRPSRASTIRRSRWVHWVRVRIPALAMIALLALATSINMASQPKRYAEINAYSQIFTTMLPMSPDPENDLRWFGLDPSLAKGAGTNIYSPGTVAFDPAYDGFSEAVSVAKVAMFYLSQPGRLVKLFDAGLNGMAGYNTETYMANYPEHAGVGPYAKETRVSLFSWLSNAYRAVAWLLVAQWLLVLTVCLTVLRHWRSSPGRRSVGILGLFLLSALSIQFWAVMMTEGQNEIFKHLIVVDLMMLLTVPVLIAAWAQRKNNNIEVEFDPDADSRTHAEPNRPEERSTA